MADFFITSAPTHQAMTKGQWEKAQADLGRPVSLVGDGPCIRPASRHKQTTRDVESILDGVTERTGKRKL